MIHSHRLNDSAKLAGYWRLNSNASDYSGNGNAGTVSGMTYGERWDGKSCGVFDGNDDNVNVGDLTCLNSVSQFSVSFWMNQDVLDQTDYIFYKHKDDTNRLMVYSHSTGNMYFSIYNVGAKYGYFDYSTVVSAGKWAFVTVVYDGSGTGNAGRLKVYVDGVEQTLTFSGTIPATTADLSGIDATIGKSSDSFDGKLSEFRIYNCALTNDEILALMRMSYPEQSSVKQPIDLLPYLADSSLTGSWLNRETGTTGKDLSDNNNDAAASNADWEKTGAKFANGGLTWASTAFDSYGYWHKTTGAWSYYFSNNGTVYTNGVVTGSMPVTVTATGFSAATCTMKDLRVYTGSKSADWISNEFKKAVPDDSLILSILDGTKELSKHNRSLSHAGSQLESLGNGIRTGANGIGYVKTPYAASTYSDEMTVCFWAKSDITNYTNNAYLVNAWELVGNKRQWAVRINAATDKWSVITSDDGTATNDEDTSKSVDANWHYHTFVVDNANHSWKYYQDGEYVETLDSLDTYTNKGSFLTFGSLASGSTSFDGVIRGIDICNEQKSSERIKEEYCNERKLSDWIKEEYERNKKYY